MPAVELESTNGMEKLVLRTPQGSSAEVYLHGAHVTSWKLPNGKEVLFLSKHAVFKPPKAIRGGVTVCFPQAGQFGPLGQHGFARNSKFDLVQSDAASATLVLNATGQEDARYPHPFELTVRVSLLDGNTLEQELTVVNTGTAPMSFTAALHTYYAVSSIGAVQIEGLEKRTYRDKLQGGEQHVQEGPLRFEGPVDRMFYNVPDSIKIIAGGSTIEVRKTNFPDVDVWNPWAEAAKAMSDFGDEEYEQMLTVQPAMAVSGPRTLEPGESWSAQQVLEVQQTSA